MGVCLPGGDQDAVPIIGLRVSTDDFNYNGNKIYGDGKKGVFRKKTVDIGSFLPEQMFWSLHDMHGNVWEWCEDWYGKDYYKNSPRKRDPERGRGKGQGRVLRAAGSWDSGPEECRCANRGFETPDHRENNIGFRVVLRTLPAE